MIDHSNMSRDKSFGKEKLTLVDRLGVYLSFVQIKKYLKSYSSPIDVLDMGCGYNATLLQKLIPQINLGLGVDIQINDIVVDNPKLKVHIGTIENFIQSDIPQKFDVIFMISVLEHLTEPLTCLDYCARHLNPGGLLLINVPTWRGKFFLEFSAFKLHLSPMIEMNDHKMYYDKRDLWPLLVKAGFKPSDIQLKVHKFGLNLFAVVKR